MLTQQQYESLGNTMFRYRSYIPLLGCIFFIIGAIHFTYPCNSHAVDLLWECICLTLSAGGLLLRFYIAGHTAKGTSGRNTKRQKAESLNTTGMYSIIRHPLYLANAIIWLGVALFLHNILFAVMFVAFFYLFYNPIMFAEETFLRRKFETEYDNWADKTPRCIPNFSLWKSPELPFDFKKALKNEYNTFFAIIVTYTAMEILTDLSVEHSFVFDPFWCVVFVLGGLAYLAVRYLVKRTDMFKRRTQS